MSPSEIMEALMLAAFSIGWYWSILAMLLTRRPYGKSQAFVTLTVIGYGFGVTSQIIEWRAGTAFSWLVIIYAWNLAVTAVDLLLFVRLSRPRAESLPQGVVRRRRVPTTFAPRNLPDYSAATRRREPRMPLR